MESIHSTTNNHNRNSPLPNRKYPPSPQTSHLITHRRNTNNISVRKEFNRSSQQSFRDAAYTNHQTTSTTYGEEPQLADS